jgi:hypothetical protein
MRLAEAARLGLACVLLALFGVVLVVAGVRFYEDFTQPSSPSGAADRLDPWPTRAATLFMVVVWILIVPNAAILLARISAIRSAPLVTFSVLVVLVGLLPLLALLAHINTCHTDTGFPWKTSC